MFKLEILTHWIVPQQGKNHSEIDEEPYDLVGYRLVEQHMICRIP